MRHRLLVLILTLLAGTLAGCTSSGNSVVCSFDSPATLADSAWPKFRHDLQNSGTVTNPLVAMNTGQMQWVFPAKADSPKLPFAASPVINGGTDTTLRIYIGSTDGYMYAVNPADGTQDPTFYFVSPSSITSTALVARRFARDALFFGGGDGLLYGVDSDGLAQVTNWPGAVGGFLSASPTIGSDGTIYGSSLNGSIAGVCPNGVDRFLLSTTSGGQSSPAIGRDAILYYGGDDRQLRAVASTGVLQWTFSASGAILNAPVLAIDNNDVTTAIYVADDGGSIFKVGINGLPVSGFKFSTPDGVRVGPMQSSPALADNRLYVGSNDGKLYAVDATTGTVAWAFPTDGPIVSSPAVATGGPEPVIVVGSNDGNVYFVLDDGATPTLMATFPIGAAVRSSPAIGADGTVYVGADDGRLYAIH
jgi:outer membrane protein assembly factor BamB